MKNVIFALGLLLLGAASTLASLQAPAHRELLLGAGVLLFLTGLRGLLNRRTGGATLRLDHFLPFVNRRWRPSAYPGPMGRLMRRVLPAACFTDPVSGRQGALRRLLRRVGPSLSASPTRRVIQAICFAVFAWLFFHVCWPYTARPAGAGGVAGGWSLATMDDTTLAIRLRGGGAGGFFAVGRTVFLVDASTPDARDGLVGEYAVAAVEDGAVRIEPRGEPTPEQLDRLLLGGGPWELRERRPGQWPSHYADDLAAKEWAPAELFLTIDPLVSLSTALASRSWVCSLTCAGVILLVCVLIPRGFCGYLCPLGTLIDLFDWLVGRRVKRFRAPAEGWWVHIKYFLLLFVLLCAGFGVLFSGFVAAIPVITRGFLFLGEPLQTGLLRGWHLVPPMNVGHLVSVALFLGVLSLGFLRPRFWCKYVCPSGAVFSIGNLFRITERKVEESCINCNKCVEICPFDAIKPDYSTRETDCTFCQTCGGVCPSHSIKFVERWNGAALKPVEVFAPGETPLGRRGFAAVLTSLAATFVSAATATTTARIWGAGVGKGDARLPVRPPGSVPEQEFLQMCIRCGECFKACPNNVLQAQGFAQGIEGLWTPVVEADWAGCDSSCNACGQVCPTGAIRPLPLAEKKQTRMGLAIVNEQTCLPFAGREACQLCVDECHAAGYDAIEFTRVGTQTDAAGNPVEGTGFTAPVVLADKCVGCGLCQTRCHVINVKDKGLLDASAIVIHAGKDREDRRMG